MKKQTIFDLSSMPKMILVITIIVMLGSLFGAVSYLLKMSKTDLPIVNPIIEDQVEEISIMTEKLAVDVRCGEKIKFDNSSCHLSRIINGYEFDEALNKCKEVKVYGGCDFETPFKTLEECQEVCEKNSNTSDWQTYRNEEFGFEIKYFPEWNIDIEENVINKKREEIQLIRIDNLEILSGDAEIFFSIRKNVLLEDVLQAEKNLYCYNDMTGSEHKKECSFCNIDESDIVVAGHDGKKISKISKEIKCKDKGDCESLCIDRQVRTVVFQKDNIVYALNTSGGEQSLEMFNQILSSFKFIEN